MDQLRAAGIKIIVNPNRIPLCRYVNNHCKYGNQCTYRHQIFPMQPYNINLPSISQKNQQHRPLTNNQRVSQDDGTIINEILVCGFIRRYQHLLLNQVFP